MEFLVQVFDNADEIDGRDISVQGSSVMNEFKKRASFRSGKSICKGRGEKIVMDRR